MTQRVKHRPRCYVCGLTPTTCVCAGLPRLRFDTPIAIVQHVLERHKPTNTGRLFTRVVEGTIFLSYGARGEAFDPAPLRDAPVDWRLLYPREGAPLLESESRAPEGKRLGLVLLDGTWAQCARMSRRLPGIAELPCVALPAGPRPLWTIRTQPHPQGRSTFEAAIDALEILERGATVSTLRRTFAEVTARVLHLKGKLRTPEIPASWTL